MAKRVMVEVKKERTNQTGVRYLIEDTQSGVVKRADVLLRNGEVPQDYGEYHADDLFAKGDVVRDGDVLIDRKQEEAVEDIHGTALFNAALALKNGGDLGDMIDAMDAVYTSKAGRSPQLTAFVQAYRGATAAERATFTAAVLFALVGLNRGRGVR
jgi:hypothetical protein